MMVEEKTVVLNRHYASLNVSVVRIVCKMQLNIKKMHQKGCLVPFSGIMNRMRHISTRVGLLLSTYKIITKKKSSRMCTACLS